MTNGRVNGDPPHESPRACDQLFLSARWRSGDATRSEILQVSLALRLVADRTHADNTCHAGALGS